MRENDTAEKLKGYNIRVRFVDGEDLYLKVDFNTYDEYEWFGQVDEFINDADNKFFPVDGIVFRAGTIKYVIKI